MGDRRFEILILSGCSALFTDCLHASSYLAAAIFLINAVFAAWRLR